MKDQKSFTIRIDEDILRKFQYVAKYDARSASGQILHLIHQCIRDFEKEHGKIDLSEWD